MVQRLVLAQVLLNVADAVLHLVSVVDVDVSCLLVGALIYLYDGFEKLFYARAFFERRGHHGRAEQRAQHIEIDDVAPSLELVVHVQRADHPQVHVEQLRRQVEVALQVRGVDDVDDHVGQVVRQVSSHVQLLGRIARQRVGARQVRQLEIVSVE